MPVHAFVNEFPRMLFRGDDTRVVANADEKAAALADGWSVRLLPGETADEYAMPEALEALTDEAAADPAPAEPKKKGRGPKE